MLVVPLPVAFFYCGNPYQSLKGLLEHAIGPPWTHWERSLLLFGGKQRVSVSSRMGRAVETRYLEKSSIWNVLYWELVV